MSASSPKKILITFGRSFLSLELARQLHGAGHQIFIADSMTFTVGRFSNSIKKSFKVPSPRFSPNEYVNSLINIVKKHEIDLIIPIYEEISWLSKVKDRFPTSCHLFFPDFELFDTLHNKWSYHCLLESLGIETLKASLVDKSIDKGNFKFDRPYALKACYSRASQKVRKVQPNESLKDLIIDPTNPWIAQEWMDGERFCTYSICHQGVVTAHSTYPVRYAIDGNSCVTFESVNHKGVFDWVCHFAKKINFTGQIAFDFIESKKDKRLYTIECNPRATSGIMLFDSSDRLDKAFLQENTTPIFPKPRARKQIATGMLMYGWRKNALPGNNMKKFLKDLFTTQDVVLRLTDLKPFIFEPLVIANIYKNSFKFRVSLPDAFIHDHEWNGEPITAFCKE